MNKIREKVLTVLNHALIDLDTIDKLTDRHGYHRFNLLRGELTELKTELDRIESEKPGEDDRFGPIVEHLINTVNRIKPLTRSDASGLYDSFFYYLTEQFCATEALNLEELISGIRGRKLYNQGGSDFIWTESLCEKELLQFAERYHQSRMEEKKDTARPVPICGTCGNASCKAGVDGGYCDGERWIPRTQATD